jgi:hypothetical protein
MKYRFAFAAFLCLVAFTGVLAQGVLPPVPADLKAEPTPDPVPVAKLTWKAPAGLWGYVVYRSVDDTSHFQKLAMVNAPVFYDQQVKVGYTFYYYVTSVYMSTANRPVESGPSNIARISFGTTPDRPIGIIAGTVKDDSTGKPIPGVRILFYRTRSAMSIAMPTAVTDSFGQYMAKLDTGVYKVKAEPAPWMPPGPPQYLPEWFDDRKDEATANPVTVIKNASVVADFGLSRPMPPPVLRGTIAGKVIDDATQRPIPGMFIRFFKKGPVTVNWQPVARTDSLGLYTALLDTGTYLIKAESVTMSASIIGYIAEWYDNVTDVSLATPVPVTGGSAFRANFALSKVAPPVYAAIEGKVTDALGAPLRHATVAIMHTLQEMNSVSALSRVTPGTGEESMDVEGVGFCQGVVWKGYTDTLGNFKARVRADRAYIAVASKWGYIPEYFDQNPDPLLADIIKVPGDVKNINFSLAENPVLSNSISGVVQDAAGNGVPSIIVLFPVRLSPVPAPLRFGHTDANGAYTIGDVVLGTYIVLAVPFSGYAPAFYKAGTYGVMHWHLAERVLINGDISGINVGVVPIRPMGVARLSGTVLSGGSALAGVRVIASSPAGDVMGYGLTDEAGRYGIEALPSGTAIVSVDRPDYTTAERSVSISADQFEVKNVNFTIELQTTTDAPAGQAIPAEFTLHQNFPNPFNPSTQITFSMPASGWATMTVFNMLGQEVRTMWNGPAAAGINTLTWNATDGAGVNVASGLYFYRLTVTGESGKNMFTGVRKMLLVR